MATRNKIKRFAAGATTCCGVQAMEIRQAGKPSLFRCLKCGRKWEAVEIYADTVEEENLIYLETLEKCLTIALGGKRHF